MLTVHTVTMLTDHLHHFNWVSVGMFTFLLISTKHSTLQLRLAFIHEPKSNWNKKKHCTYFFISSILILFIHFWTTQSNSHYSGSSSGRTNKEPSKPLPRATIQMWSTVWQTKHWSIPSSKPFCAAGKDCGLWQSLSEFCVSGSVGSTVQSSYLEWLTARGWLLSVMLWWGFIHGADEDGTFRLLVVRQEKTYLYHILTTLNQGLRGKTI